MPPPSLLALALPAALLLGRLPLELAALGLALAAVLAGWLSPAEALAGFGNPATLAVLAMFVISAAVVRTGALAPIERWLAGYAHLGLTTQLLLLAAVVGPLSAVLSNTAVVAMFIPLVERWCRRIGLAPAQMLMPLSFLTVLAGVGTLLGTSTNLVASSLCPAGLWRIPAAAIHSHGPGHLWGWGAGAASGGAQGAERGRALTGR
jgi:Na+/H+ antiporter NhaD/arsenite permease-like protein